MYRRPTAHSSCCSARTAPTRRRTAGRLGKMPTTSVRHRISLLRRSRGLLDQIFFQWASGKLEKARTSGPASSSREATWERVLELSDHPLELGMHLLRGRLLVDGAYHGGHPGLSAPGDPSEQVGHEVGAAPLPTGPTEDSCDGIPESLMSVRYHQFHPAEAPAAGRWCVPWWPPRAERSWGPE